MLQCTRRAERRSKVSAEGVLEVDGFSLTTSDLVAARTVRIRESNWERIRRSQRQVDQYVHGDRIVYGINTSCGSLVDRVLPLRQLNHFQHNLLRAVATQVGDPLAAEVVRAAMVARINSLARGFSGITETNLRKFVAMVNSGIIPFVPRKGSLGASGDLGPLASIALAGSGEGKAFYRGELLDAKDALMRAGLEPMRLQPKEGLAMINGTSMMTALASFVIESAALTAKTADAIAALSMDALCAHSSAFDPCVHRLKFHPGQAACAANIFKLTEGSQLQVEDDIVSRELYDENKDKLVGNRSELMSRPIEDAYSLRCHAQFLGPGREMLAYAGATIERELNSSNDNPLLIYEDSSFVHNGHFHGQAIACAMDNVKIHLQPVGILSDRRVDRFLDTSHSAGLSSLLIPANGLEGIRMGYMGVQFMTASLVAENRTLALPASVQSIPTTADFQDVVSMGLIAARQAQEVVENVQYILAGEALVAAHALDLRCHQAHLRGSKASKAVRDCIRTVVPPDNVGNQDDPLFQPLLEKVAALIASGQLLDAAEEALGEELALIQSTPTPFQWAPPVPSDSWPKPAPPIFRPQAVFDVSSDLEN